MDAREELVALRRMAELEAKASGQPSSGIPTGRGGVSQIPTEPGANLAPTVAPPLSTADKIRGVIETPFAVGAAALSGIPIYLAGAGGPEFQRKVAGEIQYQPRTQLAQEAVESVGRAAEASKIPPYLSGGFGGAFAPKVAPAFRAVTDVVRAEGALVKDVVRPKLEARAARIQQERAAESYKAAPRIEAAQAGQRLGVALNPAESNPTVANKLTSVLGGTTDIDARLSKFNIEKITDEVRKDLGVTAAEKLDDAAINRALDQASKPYEPIRALPVLQASDEVFSSIKALDKPATLGGKTQASAVTTLIDEVTQELQAGRSGAQIIDDIRQLRRNAQTVYKARDKGNNPPPADIAQADARMGIANALEKLIDENAPNPRALSEFQQARQRLAQIYDHERALDYGTNTIDPKAYAKMLDERKGKMTGVGADIGKVASNFPTIVGTQAAADLKPRLTRSGIAGTLGFLVGGVPGAAIGAGTGYLASAASAKRMMTPTYQAARAIPPDYRSPVNMLRPVEPNLTPNALAPYDYSQAAFTPPNFTMPPNQYPPRTTFVGPETGTPQLGMGREPVGGGQTAALRAEDARLRAMYEARDLQAQAAAAEAEAAARKPATGGTPLVFDESGKLVPADQTLRGATPNIQVIESTGKNLSGAADILASGRSPALMSAEQKIAWEKTKVDLADIVPGMKALNDKAIAAKMMDRAWVESAIVKAQEKAAAFDEMSKRATNAQLIRDAAIKREQMLDAVEALQEQLSAARPVSSGSQGPKTQAAQRNKNAMRPLDVEIKNALIGK